MSSLARSQQCEIPNWHHTSGHSRFHFRAFGRSGKTTKGWTDESGLLEQSYVILADRGFDIQESVGLFCATVRIPAFTRGKKTTQCRRGGADATDCERTHSRGACHWPPSQQVRDIRRVPAYRLLVRTGLHMRVDCGFISPRDHRLLLPAPASSAPHVNSKVRSLSTRQNRDFALPRVRTEAGKRRFLRTRVVVDCF